MMPSQPNARLDVLHVIQGLALLGILLLKVQEFTHQDYRLPIDPAQSYIPVQLFMQLLVAGQVYLIYAFLFGINVYRYWEHCYQAGLDADRIIRRGLWILLTLSLISAPLFWGDNILFRCALLSFSLLYFTQKSLLTLWKWWISLTGVLFFLIVLNNVFPPTGHFVRQPFDVLIKPLSKIRLFSAFWHLFHSSKQGLGVAHPNSVLNGLITYGMNEIILLFGLLAGKLELMHRMKRLKVRFSLLILLSLPAGLLLKGVAVLSKQKILIWPPDWQWFQLPLESLLELSGTLLLALVYLLEAGLNLTVSKSGWTARIGQVGQMGLTNYLLQTLLCVGFFYGYRLNHSAQFTGMEMLLIAIGFFLVEVGFTYLWLKRYQHGPLEWLWYRLTYGKSRQPLPVKTDIIYS